MTVHIRDSDWEILSDCLLDVFDDQLPNGNRDNWLNLPQTLGEKMVVKEIREFLVKENRTEKGKLLHVGVGNSALAVALSEFFEILGLTLIPQEADYANSLTLKGYRTILKNKYNIKDASMHSAHVFLLQGEFDVIVDVNLFSHSCCLRHGYTYFEALKALLKPNGIIMTHAQGLAYTYPEIDPNWSYNEEGDLERLARYFGFLLDLKPNGTVFFQNHSPVNPIEV